MWVGEFRDLVLLHMANIVHTAWGFPYLGRCIFQPIDDLRNSGRVDNRIPACSAKVSVGDDHGNVRIRDWKRIARNVADPSDLLGADLCHDDFCTSTYPKGKKGNSIYVAASWRLTRTEFTLAPYRTPSLSFDIG